MAADTVDIIQAATPGGTTVRVFSLPLFNLEATADPVVGNDDSQGYVKGSLWVNKTAKTAWLCVDNATGAAVWHQIDASGGGGGAPVGAEYLTKSTDATLTAERVVTDTSSLVADWTTAGQVKFNVQFGTSASVACVGNDSRLSDARTPTGTAGGGLSGTYPNPSVSVTESGLSLSDVVTDNVTSARHGFAPKSPGSATNYLQGGATPLWAQVQDTDLLLNNTTTNDVSTSAHGFCPILPGGTTTFLRGDGTYATPVGATANVYTTEGATQSGFAAETNLSGGQLTIPAAGVKANTIFNCRFRVAKTGAGTAAPILKIYIGTNGNNTDTNVATLTFTAGTAVADDGIFEVWLHMQSKSTTATCSAVAECRHRLTTTGLVNAGANASVTGGGAVNNNAIGGQKITLTVNGGTSASWTITAVESELLNLP